jgi:hypothetical protein
MSSEKEESILARAIQKVDSSRDKTAPRNDKKKEL